MVVLQVLTTKSPVYRRQFHLNWTVSLLEKITFLWLFFFIWDNGHDLLCILNILRIHIFVFIWTNFLFTVTCIKNNLILLINPLYHEDNIPDQCKEFALTHVSLTHIVIKKKWLIALLPYLILVWPGSSTLQCHLTECPWRRTFKLVHVSLYF